MPFCIPLAAAAKVKNHVLSCFVAANTLAINNDAAPNKNVGPYVGSILKGVGLGVNNPALRPNKN